MQLSFNSIFELRWALCKDVFITSCLSKLPQRPQPVFLNNFSPFYYKSARTWEVLLRISFQSDLKVFIDSLKLIFLLSPTGFAFCTKLLQSGQVLVAGTTRIIFLFSLCSAREKRTTHQSKIITPWKKHCTWNGNLCWSCEFMNAY